MSFLIFNYLNSTENKIKIFLNSPIKRFYFKSLYFIYLAIHLETLIGGNEFA